MPTLSTVTRRFPIILQRRINGLSQISSIEIHCLRFQSRRRFCCGPTGTTA